MDRSNVAVDDAVKEVMSEVAAEAKALDVAVSYKKDVGIYASLDAGKLNRVLANMIINAIQAHEKPGFVMVEAIVDEKDLAIDSLVSIWPIADWFEREVWDMFGIKFKGHPNLKRILMYEEFKGHPLRKDYPYNKRQPLVGPQN